MKPIFILAVAAIAATGIGAASLNNVIDLNVQQFGVGSEDIVTPLDAADIQFVIEPIKGEGEFKNLITACTFHSEEDLDEEEQDYRIICKLTDEVHAVIAEGEVTVSSYTGSTELPIPMQIFAFENANLVQNVHDVTLVVIEIPEPVV